MDSAKIETIIQPIIDAAGFELWGCEFSSQGRHSVLRVYIDGAQGVTIDVCSQISKQLNAVLTVEDPISRTYNLEVSSPGLERKLMRKSHYERYIDHKIDITLHQPRDGQRHFKAILKMVNEQGISIQYNDQIIDLAFNEIAKAKLIWDGF